MASTTAGGTTSATLDRTSQRNILIAMCTALMAVIASVSGLNVAQQELALDLDASQTSVLWIINSYTIALAALLLPIGALGDRRGRKPVLQAGLLLFGASSLLAALAPTTGIMIGARILTGVGAAMIMPVTLSVITSSFPEEDRAQAIGIWSGVAGSGGLIGMFASAFMVDYVTWRWLFVLPIALVAISFAYTQRFVPNSTEDEGHPFDVGGSILSLFAIGGIVLGIHEGPERGWGDWLTVSALVVGVASLVGFLWWERRQDSPLLDVEVFRNRALATSSYALLIMFGVMFGIFLVLFPFFQAVLGWSALRSAVALLPMAAAMMPMSVIAPRIAARIGSRNTMLIGTAVAATGLVSMALFASVEGGYLSVLGGLIGLGLGMGMAMTPGTEAITAGLPAEKQGVASALNDTTREVGGAFGVALLGSILSAGYASSIEPALQDLPHDVAEVASEGIGNAFGVAQQAGDAGPGIIAAAQEAFVDGWTGSMWVGVAMILSATAVLALRGQNTRSTATSNPSKQPVNA